MRHLFLFAILAVLLTANVDSYAQDTDEVGISDNLQAQDQIGGNVELDITDDKSIDDKSVSEPSPSQAIENTYRKGAMAESVAQHLTPSAIENMMFPEQVFCYRVSAKPKNYKGYTLDGLAIMSFCGIVNDEFKQNLIEQLFSRPQNISQKVENCQIKPQLMFRFIRGVDATDIMLSSPCHSYTVFYAGSIHTFNLAPIADSVDGLIGSFSSKAVDFVSPALLNQYMPIGVAQSEEQHKKVEDSKGPIRKWQQEKEVQTKQKTGWNKLKFK